MSTPAPSECRSCGAPIFWALMSSGKTMPVDAEPTVDGNVRLSQRGAEVIGHVVPPGTEGARLTHFSTCPHAAEHRRRQQQRRLL